MKEGCLFVEYDWNKANVAAELLRQSYQLSYSVDDSDVQKETEPYFFLSYTTHGDTHVAELLRNELKRRGYGYPDSLKDRVNEFLDKVCEGL